MGGKKRRGGPRMRLLDGSLDRQYLRVSAVYRLFVSKKIDKQRAVELIMQKHPEKQRKSITNLVNIWSKIRHSGV